MSEVKEIDIRTVTGKKTISVQSLHITGKQLIHVQENSTKSFRIKFLSLLTES